MPEKLSDDEVIKIQTLYHDQKMNIPQISAETGHPESTIHKYINMERIRPPVAAVPKEEKKEEKIPEKEVTKKVKLEGVHEPATPIESPYPEIPEPDKWLEAFLNGYKLYPPFVQAQCARVKRRNALPTPADLMADLQAGQSGQKNILMIRDIVEDYDFVVEKYMKERDALMNVPYVRRRGIPVRQPVIQQQMQSRGIPLRNQPQPQPQPQYDTYGQPINQQPQQQYDTYGQPIYYDQREGIPLNQPQQGGPLSLAQQLRDIVEVNRLLQGTQQQTNPQMVQMTEEMAEMRRERRDEKDRQIQNAREQLNREYLEKQQLSAEYRDMEEKLRSANMALNFEKTNKRTTEEDVRMKEVDTKFNIESKKLEESGKSRNTYAKMIESGIGQAGQVIARTIQALGSEEQVQMKGTYDSKNMWEAECPFCQTPVTAPLSAKMIECPGCGRKLEVTGEQRKPPERIERPPPINQPPPQTGTFTVENPPIRTETPTAGQCPFCKAALTLPPGAGLVECPNCKKHLKVVPEKPPIEKVPEEKKPYGDYVAPDSTMGDKPVSELIDKGERPSDKYGDLKKPPEEKPFEGEHVYVDKEIHPMEAPPSLEKREQLPKHKPEPEQSMEKFPKSKPEPPSEESFKKSEEPHLVHSAEGLEKQIEKEKAEKKKVKKIAENVGEGADKLEEEIKELYRTHGTVVQDGYTLYETKTKSGHPFHYFAKQSDKGIPCTKIPEGYEIGKNQRSGVPNLKKVKK